MKIRLFSHFTGLVDSASPFRDSMEHINFYLLCLTQLAAPQPVVSLFPDTEDGIAWLKPVKVNSSLLAPLSRVRVSILNFTFGNATSPVLLTRLHPITCGPTRWILTV
jgi:hypothetical protein